MGLVAAAGTRAKLFGLLASFDDHAASKNLRFSKSSLVRAVYLSFDGFEPADLPLGRAVAPGQHDRCAHGVVVGRQALGEASQRRDRAALRPLLPGVKAFGRTVADEAGKRLGERDRLFQFGGVPAPDRPAAFRRFRRSRPGGERAPPANRAGRQRGRAPARTVCRPSSPSRRARWPSVLRSALSRRNTRRAVASPHRRRRRPPLRQHGYRRVASP